MSAHTPGSVVMNFANHSSRAGTTFNQFVFGPVTIKMKGLGVFIPGSKFAERFAAFDADTLRAINREAWKQRKAAERTANRYNNVTLHGWSTYENASLHEDVAKAVCSASWAALNKAAS
jgi:hypothetical protein